MALPLIPGPGTRGGALVLAPSSPPLSLRLEAGTVGAASASMHGRRLQGSSWADITQGEALALLSTTDVERLPNQPDMHGSWQRWQGEILEQV